MLCGFVVPPMAEFTRPRLDGQFRSKPFAPAIGGFGSVGGKGSRLFSFALDRPLLSLETRYFRVVACEQLIKIQVGARVIVRVPDWRRW